MYVRDVNSGRVTVYFTDSTGHLLRTEGGVRDAPWDYTVAFTPQAGTGSRSPSRAARVPCPIGS